MDSTGSIANVVTDIQALAHRARADRRATSVPLLAFGVVAILDALVRAFLPPVGSDLLIVLAPAGFILTWSYYRRHEITFGVGTPHRSFGIAAVCVGVLLVLAFGFLFEFGLYPVVGIGLLAIVIGQRNLFLGAFAVIYGVVGGLESRFLISNRLYVSAHDFGLFKSTNGYFSWSSSLVYGILGLATLCAGVYSWKVETRA